VPPERLDEKPKASFAAPSPAVSRIPGDQVTPVRWNAYAAPWAVFAPTFSL
jgi:hypothetical protein